MFQIGHLKGLEIQQNAVKQSVLKTECFAAVAQIVFPWTEWTAFDITVQQ